MRIIQGFITKESFINNSSGQVADFFELSPLAMTYSRARGEYQHNDFQGDVLHTFTAKESSNNQPVLLTLDEVNQILTLVSNTVQYCNSHTGSFSSLSFVNYIRTMFNTQLATFEHGDLHTAAQNSYPEWISWKTVSGNEFQFWLRSAAFENQYTYYEIVVKPPITPLESFFNWYSTVVAALNAKTISTFMEELDEARSGYPATFTKILEFKFYNTANPIQYTNSRWGILVYGRNGDNIDSIKDAVIDYLEANSDHLPNEWQLILPEVYQRTEFLVYPRWDIFAIHNTTELSSIYRTIQNATDSINFLRTNHPEDIADSFLVNKTEVLPLTYKGVSCVSIPGQTNDVSIDSLVKIYPDYIPIPTSHIDFVRMTVNTREWILKLLEAVQIAETTTEFSTVLNPFRRIRRNNQTFIAFLYGNINYLVAAKLNNLEV